MALHEGLRWDQLRPDTTGRRVAAGAAAIALLCAVGTGANMVLLTGNRTLGAASLVAFVYTLQLLVTAALALGLGVLAWHKGARLAGVLLVPTAIVLVGISLIPVSAQRRRAHEYGVDLSVRELLHPTLGSGHLTDHQAIPTLDGGEVGIDVWRAGGPPAATTRPAVVLIHGGAWTAGAPGQAPAWNRALPDLGFVVFDVAYRVPAEVPAGWRPEIQVGDVKCAIGWVHDHAADLGIDPTRISAMGQSSGGNIAMLAGYTTGAPELAPTCAVTDAPVRSIVNLYGPADLRTMEERSPAHADLTEALLDYLGGSPTEVAGRYDAFSPIRYVRRGVPPTVTLSGENDQLVPVSLTRDLGRALDAAGATHEEWYLPGTDHSFDLSWGAFNTQIARAKITDFLRRYG